ncbi:hypothetical protein QYF36_016605 [Acer negundo]|nr:hypothetical protein QYF36_016605 [Acer negundo]
MKKFSNGGADLYIRLAHSELEKKDNKVVVIVPVVAGIITCAICSFFLWRWMAKHKALKDKSRALLLDRDDTCSVKNLNNVELQDLPLFNFEKLATATNNFHLTNKLGQGGFGPVYKGELQDGKEIAVKRLSKASGQGIEEFKNETLAWQEFSEAMKIKPTLKGLLGHMVTCPLNIVFESSRLCMEIVE